MDGWTHITLFDKQYPVDKQAEGIAIHEAVVSGECNRCGFLTQCENEDTFIPPVFAWCSRRKTEILVDWNRRADDGKI